MTTPFPQKILLTISSTFTVEPIAEAFGFWMQFLDIPSKIEFAPYNQVFQQLLDSSSFLAQNTDGINIILVRFEDWRKHDVNSVPGAILFSEQRQVIEKNVHDLLTALKAAIERTATPHLVCFCNDSPSALQEQAAFYSQMEAFIENELETVRGIYVIKSSEIRNTYPVKDYYDHLSNNLGHIPFTPDYYTALASIIARKIYAIRNVPYKVIVLDCDQTLWNGVVGEDGPMGVEIDPARRTLQKLMVSQHDAGVLICLCSKNIEKDVFEVFECHPEMPLHLAHIVFSRINWESKSENIKSLAQEMQLGLDSFVFIDDNPVECAEVQAICPEVLTLQLPAESERIPSFLKHVWLFDRLKVTREDRERSTLYKQNIKRQHFQEASMTFGDFIKGLDLKVTISQASPSQISRISQLSQRTNQFNVTTIKRSESEINKLCDSGEYACLVVDVSDRYGDYGLVGVCIFFTDAYVLNVDTFLLSCRALGRGIEHRMVAELGRTAAKLGLNRIVVPFLPTQKNQPALNFLSNIGAKFRQKNKNGCSFNLPTEYAVALSFDPDTEDIQPKNRKEESRAQISDKKVRSKSQLFNHIATELQNVENIQKAIGYQRQNFRLQEDHAYAAPLTATEKTLCEIWGCFLRIDRVGIHDNFFDLGGDSIISVIITSKASQAGIHVTPDQIFQFQTISELAKNINSHHPITARQGVITGHVPLHPVQTRLLERHADELHQWSSWMVCEGKQPLLANLLEIVLKHLTKHHDALRMRFNYLESGWKQFNAAEDDHKSLYLYDLSMLSRSEQLKTIKETVVTLQAKLNLSEGPMILAALFECGSNVTPYVAFIAHNLIMDMFSWSIFLEDVSTGYQQLTRCDHITLAPKTTSFKHSMLHLCEYAQSETLRSELNYWSLQAGEQTAQLPVDFTNTSTTTGSTKCVTSSLSSDETHALLYEVPDTYRTYIHEVLLLAQLLALTEWTGDKSLLCSLTCNSRLHFVEDVELSRTVGMLATPFPFLMELKGDNLGEQLKSIKEQHRRIPNGGLGYGLLCFMNNEVEIRKRLCSLHKPQVSFAYLGQFDHIQSDASMIHLSKDFPLSIAAPYPHSDHLLETYSFIQDNQLRMHWFYKTDVLRRETIENLSRAFLQALRSLIDHCRGHQAGRYTPSDFAEADLSQEELDRLVTKIGALQ